MWVDDVGPTLWAELVARILLRPGRAVRRSHQQERLPPGGAACRVEPRGDGPGAVPSPTNTFSAWSFVAGETGNRGEEIASVLSKLEAFLEQVNWALLVTVLVAFLGWVIAHSLDSTQSGTC